MVIVEIGGTVGDIESLPFLEAIRQFKKDVGKDNVIYVHLTLVPYMQAASELKTKATQHSVKELRAIGIQPDILLCRTDRYLPPGIKSKIALFCDVEEEAVITAKDVDSVYEVPLVFHREGLDDMVLEAARASSRTPADLSRWEDVVRRVKTPRERTRIAVVGKYVEVKDSYKSLAEALAHGGIANDARVDVEWVDAEQIERDGRARRLPRRARHPRARRLRRSRDRGQDPGDPLRARARACRTSASASACSARSSSTRGTSAGSTGANSSEFNPASPHRVIDLLPEQRAVEAKGGTMRLGNYPVVLGEGSTASRLYGQGIIQERHRHRYEVNNDYLRQLEKGGLRVSGVWAEKQLVEIIEIPEHPFFVASQFHPEFRSRPWEPHPLFAGFVGGRRSRTTARADDAAASAHGCRPGRARHHRRWRAARADRRARARSRTRSTR